MKKINLITGFAICTATLFFYACGGDSNKTANNDATAVATESSTQQTEGKMDKAVDLDVKSDSKGVGFFTKVDIATTIDQDMAEKGRALFESRCTSCHKANDEKLIGPGLKNITNIRTPEWIMNMITSPEEMVKKDAVAKALLEKYTVQMTYQNVDNKQTRQIYEYLRQNDAK